MRNPNRAVATLLLTVVLAAMAGTGCGPMPSAQVKQDPFFDDDAPSPITGNFDDAEARWRKDVEKERGTDPDALLSDDPAGEPERYGDVAFKDKPPPPTTFWGKVKAGAEAVGKVSFAAISVLATLGMMAAPYLLL